MMDPRELHEFIRSRRSVRRFTQEPIEQQALERLLETAVHASSAHNRQPWRFAVVTQSEKKLQLAESMAGEFARDLAADGIGAAERDEAVQRSRRRISSAPAAILLCMDLSDMDQYPDERRSLAERTMAVQSVANAGTTLLLAAHAENLAGAWICAPLFAPKSVAAALQLPPTWEPQALLLIGRPAEFPRARPRREIREVTVFI